MIIFQCGGGEYSEVGLAAGDWLDGDDPLNDESKDEDYMNDEEYAYTDDEDSSDYDGSENNSNFCSGRRISDGKNNETGIKRRRR